MRFCQLDRITQLVKGERIAAVKGLTLSEEYLQDHFPRFPVMPGVLMLEAMYQAGMWLVMATEEFEYSSVVLQEANNVRFADFVSPGDRLTVSAELQKLEDTTAVLKARGDIEQRLAVKARLVLERFNLADRGLATENDDQYIRDQYKLWFTKLSADN